MTDSPKRRSFAFRLRTLLVVVAILAGVLALNARSRQRVQADRRARLRRAAMAWIAKVDGKVKYDSSGRIRSLFLRGSQCGNLSPLTGTRDLEKLYIWNTNVNDLSPLKSLVGLQELSIADNGVNGCQPRRYLSDLAPLA